MLQWTTRRTPGRAAASTSVADGRRVDGAIASRRHARLPVDRRDVIDDVDAGDRRCEGARIAEVADDELDARGAEVGRARPASRTSARTWWPARGQRARQVAAGEPGCAGYEDAHRSATSVTGEPNSRSSPARSRSASDRVVKRARSDRLVKRDRQDELPVDRADAEPVRGEGVGDRRGR